MNKALSFFLFIMVLQLFGCSKEKEELITVSITTDEAIYNGIETFFSAKTNKQVNEVIFYFDGQNIGSSIKEPYSVRYVPQNATPNKHTVTCIAKYGNNSYTAEKILNVILRLGDEYQGGKIFHLNSSGDHGLIGSKTDLTYNGENRFIWGESTLLGTTMNNGKANTVLMSSKSPSAGFAGYHFKNGGYSQNGYSDWYIPSKQELELLKENKSFVGGFSTSSGWEGYYWSSSESNISNGFILQFNVLTANYYDKYRAFKVRPIRSF